MSACSAIALPPLRLISSTTSSALLFTRRIVDDDRRSLGGHLLGDPRADSLGRAGDDRDLARQFFSVCLHDGFSLSR
jgi:hypothetical protein